MSRLEGRGPNGAPPDTRSGRTAGRVLGAAMLLMLIGATSWSVVAIARPPRPGRLPPFDPGHMTGRDITGARASVPDRGIVLYVDDECPHCARELDAWASAIPKGRLPPSITVVTSPRSDPAGSHVPVSLSQGIIHDVDGSIAQALGVTAVPFRATLADGRVLAVLLGRTSPADLARTMVDLPRSMESRR